MLKKSEIDILIKLEAEGEHRFLPMIDSQDRVDIKQLTGLSVEKYIRRVEQRRRRTAVEERVKDRAYKKKYGSKWPFEV